MKKPKKIVNQFVKLNNLNQTQFKGFLKNKKRNYLVITQIINALVALVSGKLIANFISPEQFGLYNLQFAAFSFFFSLLVGPTITFLKASYQNLVPKVGTKPFLILLGVLSVVLFLCLTIFFNFYHSGGNANLSFYCLIFLIVPFNIMSNLIADQFNVMDKMNLFSTSSILKSLAGLCFLIILFYIFPKSTHSYLSIWGMQLLIGLIGFVYFILKFEKSYSQKIGSYSSFIKTHFQFTTPLMFMSFWSWINDYFDRYAIGAYMSLKEVGIYNASYGLGSKFFLILSPIFMVLLTPSIYQNNELVLKKKIIQKYATTYFSIGILILFIIFLLTDFIGSLLLSPSYKDGFYIIFWIALAFLIITGTYLYETIFYAQHNTKVILYSNIISALINILLNVLLIPCFGLMGAVIAMTISVLFRFGFVYFRYTQL